MFFGLRLGALAGLLFFREAKGESEAHVAQKKNLLSQTQVFDPTLQTLPGVFGDLWGIYKTGAKQQGVSQINESKYTEAGGLLVLEVGTREPKGVKLLCEVQRHELQVLRAPLGKNIDSFDRRLFNLYRALTVDLPATKEPYLLFAYAPWEK